MQQLTIEHKKVKTNQVVSSESKKQVEESEVENKRERKGAHLALSRRVCRILNSDVFYVESESTNDLYYYVKFKPDVFEWCSCMDNSTRHIRCKHLFAIEFAIRMGTLRDTDKLPAEAKRYTSYGPDVSHKMAHIKQSKSWESDNYDF